MRFVALFFFHIVVGNPRNECKMWNYIRAQRRTRISIHHSFAIPYGRRKYQNQQPEQRAPSQRGLFDTLSFLMRDTCNHNSCWSLVFNFFELVDTKNVMIGQWTTVCSIWLWRVRRVERMNHNNNNNKSSTMLMINCEPCDLNKIIFININVDLIAGRECVFFHVCRPACLPVYVWECM